MAESLSLDTVSEAVQQKFEEAVKLFKIASMGETEYTFAEPDELYALRKQGRGESFLKDFKDFSGGERSKWEAWFKIKDVPREVAMKSYIVQSEQHLRPKLVSKDLLFAQEKVDVEKKRVLEDISSPLNFAQENVHDEKKPVLKDISSPLYPDHN